MKSRDLRITKKSRQTISYEKPVFCTSDSIISMYRQAQDLAFSYNGKNKEKVSPSRIYSCGILHLIYQTVITNILRDENEDPFGRTAALAEKNPTCMEVLDFFSSRFPTKLEEDTEEKARAFFVYSVIKANPAFLKAMKNMLALHEESFPAGYNALKNITVNNHESLFEFLTYPSVLFPNELAAQIKYILENWADFLTDELREALLKGLDFIKEEEKPVFTGKGTGSSAELPALNAEDIESFTQDKNWMPNVVMMAKSTLVWLDQLSKQYKRDIHTLDAVPDEELDSLKDRGFTALWLIGLWERSPASKKIKNLCGNPDAESSAYSLKGYSISNRIGGWNALNNLKARCEARGIRLASDMVPNHTGLDSYWIKEHPEYFMQQDYPPFPSYTYNGENLSEDPSYEIKIEDHYYNRTDAAVTFMKRDTATGKTVYIFHGNDGTSLPWNDTAQLDFLNPATREAVIQQILDVARNFHIIRFDAAMTLAKKHIQRLWYPVPGQGGDIAGRSLYSMPSQDFNIRIPNEFWREVVDRIAAEVPDTLLLAEAFWMMESYFVRTLGMHRVYNSAFMHMTKNEDNKKYKDSVKSVLTFDPEILKRYVNFMNNPDEDTAVAQFGTSDKYFGVCTLLATMPGLPMFGHGQIEGFKEKYGMEYQRSYWDEKPDEAFVGEHYRRIFPLLKKRYLFSECMNFELFDVINGNEVQESVFAYTNGNETEMTLVLYNNRYEHAEGRIFYSAPKLKKEDNNRFVRSVTLAESLRLTRGNKYFTIYKNFSDGLTYIAPSSVFFNEGYYVSLNGYETRVLLEIREVYDSNGYYEALCNKLNGRGTQDIDREIALLSLEPIHNAAAGLKDEKFNKDLTNLLTGEATKKALNNILQTLAEVYTYMEEVQMAADINGLKIHKTVPAQTIAMVSKLYNLCKTKTLKYANSLLEENLCSVFKTFFLMLPFTTENASKEEAFYTAKKLMPQYLFAKPEETCLKAALLFHENGNVLQNNIFKTLSGCNEYNGILWYNEEAFQESIYINLLGKYLKTGKTENADREIAHYLNQNINSHYNFQLIQEFSNE